MGWFMLLLTVNIKYSARCCCSWNKCQDIRLVPQSCLCHIPLNLLSERPEISMETLITVFLCFPYLSLGEFDLSFVIVCLFFCYMSWSFSVITIFDSGRDVWSLFHWDIWGLTGKCFWETCVSQKHLPVKNKLIAFSNLCFIVGDSKYSRV